MQDLASVIDVIYTTHSDVERRETMAKLTTFFATPESWASLLNLFAVALASPIGNISEQKRRQRICFFAGNALFNKIKKERLASHEADDLTKSIHSLLLGQDPVTGVIAVRDPKAEYLGRETIRRLVLCLATLSSNDLARQTAYIDHAISLITLSVEKQANQLGLQMLLAIANPSYEEEEKEDDRKTPDLPQSKREFITKVLAALEAYTNRGGPTEQEAGLLLDTAKAWLEVLDSPDAFRLNCPVLFAFSFKTLSGSARVEAIRASSGVLLWLADCCKTTNDFVTKDALLEGMVVCRPRFAQLTSSGEEDACQAIASAFAKIAESDVNRIARGTCVQHAQMIDFSMEILGHPCRSSVARNALDFLLCIHDIPTNERSSHLNLFFFLRMLGQLVLSCEVSRNNLPTTPEDEDGADDVLLYRASSDGPRDLFGTIYGTLSERYVQELVAIIANTDFDYLRSEAALFALRCASKEICSNITKRDASKQQQRLVLFDLFDRFLRISFRNEWFFRASLCATIADFSPVLHLIDLDVIHTVPGKGGSNLNTVALNLEYVMKNLEDPYSDLLLENRASHAFLRLCSRHAKTLSGYLENIFVRLMSSKIFALAPIVDHVAAAAGGDLPTARKANSQIVLENRRALAEGLSRLCAVHADTARASKSVLEPLLARVRTSRGDQLEIQTIAGVIKYLPPDAPDVVQTTFLLIWPLLEQIFSGSLFVGGAPLVEDQLDAISELINAFFFCCASGLQETVLSQVLAFLVRAFHQRPLASLVNSAGKAVELFSNGILSISQCNELLVSLLASPNKLSDLPECVTTCLETIRRTFLFVPEAVLGSNKSDAKRICEFVLQCVLSQEREVAREACVVLVDMVNRTRKDVAAGGVGRTGGMDANGGGLNGQNNNERTRWNVYGPVLDEIIWNTGSVSVLVEHMSQSLLHGERLLVAENYADLLYCLLKVYPMSVPSWNGTMERTASVASKEAFRKFILERTSQG